MDSNRFTRFAFRRPLPLRWHLILLLVGTLLPATLFAAVMAHRVARHERETAERRLILSVRDLATALDREMSSTIRVLSALAESERLDRDDLQGFHREAVRVAGTQPSWLGVLLLAPDGRQLMSSTDPWGTRLPPGGTVRVFSAGSGQGSRFTLRLPLAAAPAIARDRWTQAS